MTSFPGPARMPAAVALLGGAIFAVTTAEFSVSGLLDTLSRDLDASVAQIGYLVSIYAAGMALGGPLMVLALRRFRQTTALTIVLMLVAAAQLAAAFTPGYNLLAVSRFVQGFAGAAAFGLALSIGARLGGPGREGQAAALIMGGLMIGTVLGLPLATWLGSLVGWRWVFAGLAGVAALAAGLVAALVHAPEADAGAPRPTRALADAGLWQVFATSFLLIGATFAAFTYFVPLLGQRAGISARWIPACLVLYGAATVAGNFACGRWVDRHGAWRVQGIGLAVLSAALLLFAVAGAHPAVALLSLVLIGLTGVALNPAMVARVLAIDASPLVGAVHTAVISLGLLTGAALGGFLIERTDQLGAALWVAAAMSVLGCLSLLRAPDRLSAPDASRSARA